MNKARSTLLSVVVPVLNEGHGLSAFHEALLGQLKALEEDYEVLYVDDGSTDTTHEVVRGFHTGDPRIKLLCLTRNFGKEVATTAGVQHARGDAIITIDADGQHPVELIPDFLRRWKAGNKVVIGIRLSNQGEGFVKRYGSKLFYKLFNMMTGLKLIAGASDYRLIDRRVQQEFLRLTERNRITRGLIDWLGYQRDYIEFHANKRASGEAAYSFRKLFKLAIDSVISLSVSPLYIAAYIGAVVLPVSVLVALVMVVDALIGDPLNWHATGSAYVIILLLFLVGVLLVSQGIIGLYLSHIHTETQNRPLYVVESENSLGIHES